MKVLYLFNKVLKQTVADAEARSGHDSWLFGMRRLRKHAIKTDFLELESFIPTKVAQWLRKCLLTMHYAHLPLFPLFFKYNIVFTSTAYGCLVLKALLRIKSFKWIILDFNILGTLEENKTWKQKIFYWAISRGADGVVAISLAEADAMKVKFPHLADRIIFLHEATDINFFKPLKETVEKRNVVLSVGNYARDFETVVEATENLGVELWLATKLIAVETAKHLPPNVKVKLYNHVEMARAYEEASIVVVSLKTKDRYFDSVGTLALGEALSAGKATIVTHTKSMESYITNNENGILVPREDPQTMRAAIEDLFSDGEKRARLARNARIFAEKYLDGEVFACELARFFKKINHE